MILEHNEHAFLLKPTQHMMECFSYFHVILYSYYSLQEVCLLTVNVYTVNFLWTVSSQCSLRTTFFKGNYITNLVCTFSPKSLSAVFIK